MAKKTDVTRSTAGVSRRKILGSLAAAAGAAGAPLLVPAAAAAAPVQAMIPLEFDRAASLEAFVVAAKDPEIRASLRRGTTTLPPDAREMLELLDDEEFQNLVQAAMADVDLLLVNKEHQSNLRVIGRQISELVTDRYPSATDTLRSYAMSVRPQMERDMLRQIAAGADRLGLSFPESLKDGLPLAGTKPPVEKEPGLCFEAWVCTAAIVIVVVNGGVYANVAVATHFVLAAAVAFVALLV